jgi:hypothetical protein
LVGDDAALGINDDFAADQPLTAISRPQQQRAEGFAG